MKLGEYLNISQDLVYRLTNNFNEGKFRKSTKTGIDNQRISRKELALNYKKILDDGMYRNKAELARSLNVSRAWITKVMKSLEV